MTAEWNRKAILDLIGEYKNQINLYDIKHMLYYNKKARSKSLGIICAKVCQSRPGTTPDEIHKKVQTLRTQIGQEIAKIDRSRELEDDALLHKPKVWWYESFEWITAFMKGRNDPATPLSVKLEKISKLDVFSEEEELPVQDESNIQIEEEEIEEEPTPKRPRKSYAGAKSRSTPQPTQTYEYIIQPIEQENTSDHVISNDQIVELQPENVTIIKDNERYKKRSKNFGKYVAALMQDIRNDKIFFETQTEILQIIEKATAKSYSN